MSLGVLPLLLLASAQTQAAAPAPVPSPLPLTDAAALLVGPPAPLPEPDAPLEVSGVFKGTTSQGRVFEIEVEQNTVKSLRLGWHIDFERDCLAPDTRLPQRSREGVQVMRYQYPELVRDARLKTRLGVGSDLDLLVTGAFEPAGTASGDIDLASVTGASCSGKLKASWKAARQ
jgi:hypothetical protein